MKNKMLTSILIFLIGLFIFQCSQNKESTDIQVISINVDKDNKITLNGNDVSLENLSEKLEVFDQKSLVRISFESSTKMGLFHEVHKQITNAGLSNISNVPKEELTNKMSKQLN